MTGTRPDAIRLLSFNLEHDGGQDEAGRPPRRWRDAHDLLASLRPDVLFRQEATFSAADGGSRLHAAERALGMRGFLGGGRNSTALFVRPATVHVTARYGHGRPWRIPPANVVGRLDGVPGRDIILVSFHAAYNSPFRRALEAEDLTALVKPGTAFIAAGDCNELPAGDRTGWDDPAVTDRVHVMHRTRAAADGTRVSCTYLDEVLHGCGLHDPARYAATCGQAGALAPTAGHAARPGQGGPRRTDRFYLDPHLVRAVEDVRVVDTSGLSDHHAVEVLLSRRGAQEALRRTGEPLTPMPLTTRPADRNTGMNTG